MSQYYDEIAFPIRVDYSELLFSGDELDLRKTLGRFGEKILTHFPWFSQAKGIRLEIPPVYSIKLLLYV